MSGPVLLESVVRGFPMAKPPGPSISEEWPSHQLVVCHRTARPGGGPATFGAGRLIGGEQEPEWRFYGRGVLASEAGRFFGRDQLWRLGLEDFLEEAVWKCCYKPHLRAGLVCWSVPPFVTSAAWTVDARGDSFRFTWLTYVDDQGMRKPDRFRSRVRITPSSGGRAAIGFDNRRDPDPEDWVQDPGGTRHQYRGRFASLSTLGYVLTGDDQLTLRRALEIWGIEPPSAPGAEGLTQELETLCALYGAMRRDLERWPG
jgi:hypothetical protein